MGGWGSGHQGRRRPCVEAAQRLDASTLKRCGALELGASVRFGWAACNAGPALEMTFTARAPSPWYEPPEAPEGSTGPPPPRATLDLEITDSGGRCINRLVGVEFRALGPKGAGSRAWLICPLCEGRAARLYLSARELLCRKCAGMVHRSSQVSRLERLDRKLDKLNRALGVPEFGPGGFLFQPPPRPKGMKWVRYWPLSMAWKMAALQRFDLIFTPAVARQFGMSHTSPMVNRRTAPR